MGSSSSLLLGLVVLWCLLGGLVGWVCGRVVKYIPACGVHPHAGVDIVTGMVGALAGAYYSGVVDQKRPSVVAGMPWLGEFISDHQTVVGIVFAAALVFIAGFVRPRPRRLGG